MVDSLLDIAAYRLPLRLGLGFSELWWVFNPFYLGKGKRTWFKDAAAMCSNCMWQLKRQRIKAPRLNLLFMLTTIWKSILIVMALVKAFLNSILERTCRELLPLNTLFICIEKDQNLGNLFPTWSKSFTQKLDCQLTWSSFYCCIKQIPSSIKKFIKI